MSTDAMVVGFILSILFAVPLMLFGFVRIFYWSENNKVININASICLIVGLVLHFNAANILYILAKTTVN